MHQLSWRRFWSLLARRAPPPPRWRATQAPLALPPARVLRAGRGAGGTRTALKSTERSCASPGEQVPAEFFGRPPPYADQAPIRFTGAWQPPDSSKTVARAPQPCCPAHRPPPAACRYSYGPVLPACLPHAPARFRSLIHRPASIRHAAHCGHRPPDDCLASGSVDAKLGRTPG